MDKTKIILILFIIILLGYNLIRTTDTRRLGSELIESNHIIAVTKSANDSLQKTIDLYSKEKIDLLALISQLESKPEKIKYITKTETKLEAIDPIVTYKVLPEAHSFELTNGLRVADFSAKQDYEFTTYDLSFRSTVVATDKKADSLLEVRSSYDNQWIEVPHQLTFNNAEVTRHLIDPQFVIGGQLELVPVGGAGFVGVSIIHPSKTISIATTGIGISSEPSLVLYPLDINVGEPLPLFTDLHIGIGGSLNTKGSTNGVFGIWTTL